MLDFQTARTHPQLGKAFSVLLNADDWDPREFEGVPESSIARLEKKMFEGRFRIPNSCRAFLRLSGESLSYFNYDDICAGFRGIRSSNLHERESVFAKAKYFEGDAYLPQYPFTFYRTEDHWAYLDLELGDDSPTWWIDINRDPY